MFRKSILTFLLLGTTTLAAADKKDRVLFSFDGPNAAKPWQTVNDGVMGGRSIGRFRINKDKNMEFFGNLSLENNGGFASVRSRGSRLGLVKGDALVVRLRGDGRKYTLNLYNSRRRIAFSYRATFQTKKDKWIEVSVPLSKFVPTSFGRIVRSRPLDPGDVSGIGILLGDKKAGPFKLEVESMKVRSGLRGNEG